MKQNITEVYYTPIQLKMPLDIEKIIETSDPIYTFNEVMEHMDLNQYFVERKAHETGRPGYDRVTLLKLVLFAFMEYGYRSLRELEKLCKTDIRFMWLLGEEPAPSFMTFENFIRNDLAGRIEDIFQEMNGYIFGKEAVDLEHVYIDGTKIEANANKYSWIWKKSCETNRKKVFGKITALLERINGKILVFQDVRFETRDEYAIEYVELLLSQLLSLTGMKESSFVHGRGCRKSLEQKCYEELDGYCQRLKKYAQHIAICGEKRNSYSKTDPSATFMRVKRDYMGNGQLLPAYNMQMAVCDEYIAAVDVKPYASDMDCFIPLMEKFRRLYGFYPKYPVGDAGYGSHNNYLYCEEHGMEKFLKFPMFRRETEDKGYRDDPFRAVNFPTDEDGHLICPGGKRFFFLRTQPVRGNQYGRTEELHQCESCEGCALREKCHKSAGDRVISLNRELTAFHQEVLANLNCIHGALLRMNRSIQAEGAFGGIKWDRSYKRARRRGLNGLILEFTLISCGFNLHKYDLKHQAALRAA